MRQCRRPLAMGHNSESCSIIHREVYEHLGPELERILMHAEHHVQAAAADHAQRTSLALAAGAEAHEIRAVGLPCQLLELCIIIPHAACSININRLAVTNTVKLRGLAGPLCREGCRARRRLQCSNSRAVGPLRAVPADPIGWIRQERPHRAHTVGCHVPRPDLRCDLAIRAGLAGVAGHHAGLVVVGVLGARLAEGVGHVETTVTSACVQILAPRPEGVGPLRTRHAPIHRTLNPEGPHRAHLAQAVRPVLVPGLALAEEGLIEG
mmetsp:Transcript_13788/g.34715  ORF Transcript_13788/g.34715 Transcript_13788/m.34715 type:complete len:266 (-) Transcript_13788:2567-3364(-)